MADKFEIVEMKLVAGNWEVSFTAPTNWTGYRPPHVKIINEDERGLPLSQAEVAKEAHRRIVNDLFELLRAAAISIPDMNWDQFSRTVLWSKLKTAFDGEPRRDEP